MTSVLFPDAFDTEQLLECVEKLKRGHGVNIPIYDFTKHRRCSDSFRKVICCIFFLFLLYALSIKNLLHPETYLADEEKRMKLERREFMHWGMLRDM